jgi:type IV pilus assembly protein PilO
MNIQDLNELDINDIASWPKLAKNILILFIFLLIGGAGYYMFIADSIKQLDISKKQEIELKNQFEIKASQASNLVAYRDQMVQLEDMLKNQLKQLPNKNEVAGLLDDISYIATNNGLKLIKINWEPEIQKDFYTELPMRIDLSGKYEQLGQFSADIAKLPRIVLLGDLIMSVQAKTYRYNPEQKNHKGAVKK